MDSYDLTRTRLEEYFDGTANEAWKRLMSDAPVSRIRATVRAGRDAMRNELLAQLPADLSGRRVLDAGCGAGQVSHILAERGADVVGVDISPRLLEMALATTPEMLQPRITYIAGDMLAAELGEFDHVLAMDSLIHYELGDAMTALASLAGRTKHSIVFTVAPRTPALAAMHLVGKLFPRGDRAPAIVPAALSKFDTAVRQSLPPGWRLETGTRIARGFYISQAMELHR